MSESVHRAHNVSNIMYHFVCPTKYRRVVIDNSVDEVIKETCRGIEVRYLHTLPKLSSISIGLIMWKHDEDKTFKEQ